MMARETRWRAGMPSYMKRSQILAMLTAGISTWEKSVMYHGVM
jgi:hypothetical protein